MESGKKLELEDLLPKKMALKIRSEVKETVEVGKERLKEFDEYVRKESFFLGVYQENANNNHLVLTKKAPDGTKQPAVFIFFPWVNTSEDEGFLIPSGKTEIVVLPLADDFTLMISLSDAISMFKKTSEQLR